MCGIAGFIASQGLHGDQSSLTLMLKSISHRGPDADGIWNDKNVFLGHKRLSVVDISPAGAQPMVSRTGRYIISYNGEFYNYRGVKASLQTVEPVQWRGNSDTEVILELLTRYGIEETLKKINGMFALAIWDKEAKALYLARDRFGEKPLCYSCQADGIAFASEITALEALSSLKKEIDPGSIASFLNKGNVGAPATIYKEVFKLKPGHFLRFKQGEPLAIKSYWAFAESALEWRNNPINDPVEIVDRLEAALTGACKDMMVADVPLGAFLSGGVDSSAVVALMQKNTTRRVKTFTIGFENPRFNEAHFAKDVASHLGTEHTELILSAKDSLDVAENIASVYDEPFADSSAIPTYLVSRLARSGVTVCLSGDGGDELFSGYPRYMIANRMWSVLSKIPMRTSVGRLLLKSPTSVLEKLFFPLKFAVKKFGSNGDPLGSKIQRVAEYMHADSFGAFYDSIVSTFPEPSQFVLNTSGYSQKLSEPNTGLSDVDYMAMTDTQNYLPNDILTKVDRAGMAVSLESRMPLLDLRVAEVAWRTPTKFKSMDGLGKWPLRQVLYRHVPRKLIDRPKMGFGIPVNEWLRGPLAPWASDLLSSAQVRRQGLLDENRVGEFYRGFKDGSQSSGAKLWTILMLQSWLEKRGL